MTRKPLQDAMLLQIFLSHYLKKKKNSVVICLANGLKRWKDVVVLGKLNKSIFSGFTFPDRSEMTQQDIKMR